MNAEQYAKYKSSANTDPTINILELDPGDYTLAYGYTLDRDTVHVYTMDGEIHRIIYPYRGEMISYIHGTAIDARSLRPSKRVYPDTVNEKFAYLMRDAGTDLCFLGNFDFSGSDVIGRAERGAFKGKTHLDFDLG